MTQVPQKPEFIAWKLAIRSATANRFADILSPAVKQLSSIRFLPTDHHDDIMEELHRLVMHEYHALEADHDLFATKQAEKKLPCQVKVLFGQASNCNLHCSHPLSQMVFCILRDLIELDEQWCAFAWSADLAHPVSSPEQSEFSGYTTKQAEWTERVRRLRFEIRSRVKILRQACRDNKRGQNVSE